MWPWSVMMPRMARDGMTTCGTGDFLDVTLVGDDPQNGGAPWQSGILGALVEQRIFTM